MKEIRRIAQMLEDPSARKRIAAAVVLGELKIAERSVVEALVKMARDPVDGLAEPALEALGQLGTLEALPVFIESLGRGRDLRAAASKAIAGLGQEALPKLRAALDGASPELRAALSEVLPSVGGKASFEMTLAGLYDQPFEVVNRVALSVRQEVKEAAPAARRTMANAVEKFLARKKTGEQESALRGALKILGCLQVPESIDTLRGYLKPAFAPLVRMEATTALRFSAAGAAPRKLVRELMNLLEDGEPLVARAARDSLTVLGLGEDHVEELADLARGKDEELALWAVGRLSQLGGRAAEGAFVKLVGDPRRVRAEAAAKALAAFPGGEILLARALEGAADEVAAQNAAAALLPIAGKLPKTALRKLLDAGLANLKKAAGVGRRQLEPVRIADPEGWAAGLREQLKGLKKDPARAELLLSMLARSSQATPEDRYRLATLLLERSTHDPHPVSRRRDPALEEIERLAKEGFPVAKELAKDKGVSDESRYYVGFHFAESDGPFVGIGIDLLEALAKGKKGKLAKAAKNKLKLLDEAG